MGPSGVVNLRSLFKRHDDCFLGFFRRLKGVMKGIQALEVCIMPEYRVQLKVRSLHGNESHAVGSCNLPTKEYVEQILIRLIEAPSRSY